MNFKTNKNINIVKESTFTNSGNPILSSCPMDKVKNTKALKILAILLIAQIAITVPLWTQKIYSLAKSLKNINIYQVTTNTIILYIVMFAGMLIAVCLVFVSGMMLYKNKRRYSAIILNWTAIMLVFTSIATIMLMGFEIQAALLTALILISLLLSHYIDPSYSQEKRLQNKLQELQLQEEAEKGTLGLSKGTDGYGQINYYNILFIFVFCCMMGYAFEIIWHMTVDDPMVYEERAGFLFGPFSPIYGLGGIAMTLCLNKISDKNVVIVFLASALLGGWFEFFCSLFLETAFGIKSWDYSHLLLNIDGRVALRFFIIWGVFGTCWFKILYKPILKLINKIPVKIRRHATIIVSIIVFTNAFMTLQALDCWQARIYGAQPITPIEKLYSEIFDNDFMHKRFENMKLNSQSTTK